MLLWRWSGLDALVHPHSTLCDGRRPVGPKMGFRSNFVQHWFNLSDLGVEEGWYKSPVLQLFVRVDLGTVFTPDETATERLVSG